MIRISPKLVEIVVMCLHQLELCNYFANCGISRLNLQAISLIKIINFLHRY